MVHKIQEEDKQNKDTTQYVMDTTNINNVNKTLLQTTGGENERRYLI